MISYAIAMIDVLVLRKRYPDYPRLWKVPAAKVVLPIGILGVAYAIWTLSDFWLAAVIAMAVVAVYSFAWMKLKHIDLRDKVSLAQTAEGIKASSEYLPVWDEAVEEWLQKQGSSEQDGAEDANASDAELVVG